MLIIVEHNQTETSLSNLIENVFLNHFFILIRIPTYLIQIAHLIQICKFTTN